MASNFITAEKFGLTYRKVAGNIVYRCETQGFSVVVTIQALGKQTLQNGFVATREGQAVHREATDLDLDGIVGPDTLGAAIQLAVEAGNAEVAQTLISEDQRLVHVGKSENKPLSEGALKALLWVQERDPNLPFEAISLETPVNPLLWRHAPHTVTDENLFIKACQAIETVAGDPLPDQGREIRDLRPQGVITANEAAALPVLDTRGFVPVEQQEKSESSALLPLGVIVLGGLIYAVVK